MRELKRRSAIPRGWIRAGIRFLRACQAAAGLLREQSLWSLFPAQLFAHGGGIRARIDVAFRRRRPIGRTAASRGESSSEDDDKQSY